MTDEMHGSEGERIAPRWNGISERRRFRREGGSSITIQGWGKLLIEIVVLLVTLTIWFTRLENKIDSVSMWMMHHIEEEHKERAVMHHRRMDDPACSECKGMVLPKIPGPTFK